MVPLVCLSKYRSSSARKSRRGLDLRCDHRASGSPGRAVFVSLRGKGGDCDRDEDGGGTRRGMFNASLNISMSNIALTRGI